MPLIFSPKVNYFKLNPERNAEISFLKLLDRKSPRKQLLWVDEDYKD